MKFQASKSIISFFNAHGFGANKSEKYVKNIARNLYLLNRNNLEIDKIVWYRYLSNSNCYCFHYGLKHHQFDSFFITNWRDLDFGNINLSKSLKDFTTTYWMPYNLYCREPREIFTSSIPNNEEEITKYLNKSIKNNYLSKINTVNEWLDFLIREDGQYDWKYSNVYIRICHIIHLSLLDEKRSVEVKEIVNEKAKLLKTNQFFPNLPDDLYDYLASVVR